MCERVLSVELWSVVVGEGQVYKAGRRAHGGATALATFCSHQSSLTAEQ
jgi:hypothetical protein